MANVNISDPFHPGPLLSCSVAAYDFLIIPLPILSYAHLIPLFFPQKQKIMETHFFVLFKFLNKKVYVSYICLFNIFIYFSTCYTNVIFSFLFVNKVLPVVIIPIPDVFCLQFMHTSDIYKVGVIITHSGNTTL
jgi:hypothetical protein